MVRESTLEVHWRNDSFIAQEGFHEEEGIKMGPLEEWGGFQQDFLLEVEPFHLKEKVTFIKLVPLEQGLFETFDSK